MKEAMLLTLILLTSLDGSAVWVESTAVVMIRPEYAQCKHGSAIRVDGVAICVRETPEQIQKRISDAPRR